MDIRLKNFLDKNRNYLAVASAILLVIIIKNGSYIGYTVMNQMTKTIVASYILILSLVLILIAYKFLHKE